MSEQPWFLWSVDVTEEVFRERLRDEDPAIRAQWQGLLMREARCRLRRVAGRLQGLRAGLPLALWSAGAALSLMLDAIGPA